MKGRIAVAVAAPLVAALAVASSSAGPVASKTLTVAAGADAYRAENPKFPTIGKYPVNANIFESLTGMTANYRLVPRLAVRWKLVGSNTWRFFLRRGVKFHDGSRLDANAVLYTMKLLAASGTADYIGLDTKARFRVVSRYVIDITPSFSNRRLPEQLVHPANSIIARGSSVTRPVGTGPFKFDSYERNRQIVVSRFAGYWGRNARVNKIIFKFVPDANARVLALQSRTVQAAFDVPRESTGVLARSRGLRIARSAPGAYEALYFDIRGASGYDLGRDPRIREAVALAINRSVIVKNVWHGNASVVQTMIPPRALGRYAKLVHGFRYNKKKARQILDRAGWKVGSGGIRAKNGRRLSLTLVSGFPTADIHGSMPEALQSMLKDVGIDLKIVRVTDRAAYGAMVEKGEGDLFAEIGSQNDANPCFLPDLLFYFKGTSHSDYGYRFGPAGAFDRVIESQCRKGATNAAAQRGAARAMHIIVDQKKIVIPIAGVFRIYGLAGGVRGFQAFPSQTMQRWETVSLR